MSNTKTMYIRVYVDSFYDTFLDIPENMNLQEAWEYAKNHINNTIQTPLHIVNNTENLDDEDLYNDIHTYIKSPLSANSNALSEFIGQIIDIYEDNTETSITDDCIFTANLYDSANTYIKGILKNLLLQNNMTEQFIKEYAIQKESIQTKLMLQQLYTLPKILLTSENQEQPVKVEINTENIENAILQLFENWHLFKQS